MFLADCCTAVDNYALQYDIRPCLKLAQPTVIGLLNVTHSIFDECSPTDVSINSSALVLTSIDVSKLMGQKV